MRFSALSLLALPLLGVAAEDQNPFGEYQAQFQNFLDKMGSYIPTPNKVDHAAAAEAKASEKKMSILTIGNFKDVLYEPVLAKYGNTPEAPQLSAANPEEWWLLISGGNTSCRGRCGQVEQAFNEVAVKFAKLPNAPRVAYANCDDQPILCNVFSVGPPSLWAVQMEYPGNDIDIWHKRLNTTTTTTQTLLDLYNNGKPNRENWHLLDHSFHPFNGWLAKNYLSIPVAWILWGFSVLPNWVTMLLVSFASRRMMNRRMANDPPAPGARAAPAGAR